MILNFGGSSSLIEAQKNAALLDCAFMFMPSCDYTEE